MARPPRVFISRTTAGLAALAERAVEVLRQRGIEPIIQTGFYRSTHDVKGMLAEHWGLERKAVPKAAPGFGRLARRDEGAYPQRSVTEEQRSQRAKDQADWGAGFRARSPQQCDAVICLVGTAYGSGPHDPITKAEQPVHGLKNPRTKDRLFSYTQLKLLIARDLGRPEENPNDECRMPNQAVRHSTFFIRHFSASLGTLFKGRDEFLAELRQHLTAEGPVVSRPDHPVSKCFRRRGAWSLRVPQTEATVSKVDTARGLRGSERPMIVSDEVLPKRVIGSTGKRTIHGMGGVGKTRAAIEYAWTHADDYRALLFISADTPETVHRNLAAFCGPLVLNLPEQNKKQQAIHEGWAQIKRHHVALA